jgi:pimeloyl-ACP methyl ester carboxylesterase
VVRTVRRGDLVFDVSDDGPPDGPIVVLLHGFPQSKEAWRDLTPILTAAGCRVLAPNQRGYSGGARPGRPSAYRQGELVGDVLALLDAAGADRAHIVGHDWGGAVAWRLAFAHPARLDSLSVLSTPHPRAMTTALLRSDQLLRSWYIALFQLPWLPESLLTLGNGRLLEEGLVRSGLPRDRARDYAHALREPGAARAALNWYRSIGLDDAGLVGTISVPTLFVWSTGDLAIGRDAALRTAAWVEAPYRFEVLDRVSHWIPERAAHLVAPLLVDQVRSSQEHRHRAG